MPNSQIRWPLVVAMMVVLVFAGLAESQAQKAPDVSFDRGFAPIVKQVLPAVVNIASSRTVRTLGATAQTMSPQMMQSVGLTGQPRGALVTDVTPSSPASRSGLSKGDIILEMNGEPLEDSRALSLKISMTPPGTTVRLKVFRDGKSIELTPTLIELEEKPVAKDGAVRDSHGPRFGLTVEELTPAILRALGLPLGTPGVVVANVEPGSIAEEAGLRMGDVIQEVNRKPVANIAEYAKAMHGVDTMVMFLINRKGEHAFVALEGPAEPAR